MITIIISSRSSSSSSSMIMIVCHFNDKEPRLRPLRAQAFFAVLERGIRKGGSGKIGSLLSDSSDSKVTSGL